jgi:lipopolysaccharide/colanic/teichoic acid biosynthesis glycosyltransferase
MKVLTLLTKIGKVLRDKLAIELQYLETRTVWKDLAIILETVFSVFKGK